MGGTRGTGGGGACAGGAIRSARQASERRQVYHLSSSAPARPIELEGEIRWTGETISGGGACTVHTSKWAVNTCESNGIGESEGGTGGHAALIREISRSRAGQALVGGSPLAGSTGGIARLAGGEERIVELRGGAD